MDSAIGMANQKHAATQMSEPSAGSPDGADENAEGAKPFSDSSSGSSGPFKPTGGFGMVVFGGMALALTGIHLMTGGPGRTFESLTGILYTIGAVSLSPLFFFALLGPSKPDKFRFPALYASVFCLTAPVYYYPEYISYGIGFSATSLLAALFPSWFRYFKFQGAIQGIEEGDPTDLIEALSSAQPTLRSMARIKLIELGPDIAPELIAAFKKHAMRPAHFKPDILEILRELSRPPQEQEPSIKALTQLAEFWRWLLRNSKEYELMAIAAMGLGRLQDIGAGPMMLDLLKKELKLGGGINRSRDMLFDALFDALAFCCLHPPEEGAEGIAFTRAVVSTMLDTYLVFPGLYRSEALKRIGGPVVAGVAALLPHASPRTKQELTRLLGGIKAVAAMPMLLEQAQDASSDIRFVAVEALLEHIPGGPRLAEQAKGQVPEAMLRQLSDVLIRLAGDPEERVRLKALDGLSRIGDPHALPILLDYLDSPPSPVDDGLLRGQIAANLARTRDPLLLEPLMRLLDSFDPSVVAGTCRGLGFMKDPRIVPRLKRMLTNPDPNIAASAAIGLFHQKDESGRATLGQYLGVVHAAHRTEALEILLKMADESIYPALEAGIGGALPGWPLSDRDMAVQKLIEMKTPAGLEVLHRLWNRPDLDESVVGLLRERLKAAGLLKGT